MFLVADCWLGAGGGGGFIKDGCQPAVLSIGHCEKKKPFERHITEGPMWASGSKYGTMVLVGEHCGGLCDMYRGRVEVSTACKDESFLLHSLLPGSSSSAVLRTGGSVEERAATHPSSASLLNAHVIFRRSTVNVGTKEAKAKESQQIVTTQPLDWINLRNLFQFVYSCPFDKLQGHDHSNVFPWWHFRFVLSSSFWVRAVVPALFRETVEAYEVVKSTISCWCQVIVSFEVYTFVHSE